MLVVDITKSVGASLILWAGGLILSISGLLIWLEFGCMIPRSGGEKVYLEAVFPKPKLLSTTLFAVYSLCFTFTGIVQPYPVHLSTDLI